MSKIEIDDPIIRLDKQYTTFLIIRCQVCGLKVERVVDSDLFFCPHCRKNMEISINVVKIKNLEMYLNV